MKVGFLSIIYKAVKGTVYWDRAMNLASQEKHEEALRNLEYMEGCVPLAGTDRLLQASLHFRLGNYDNSLHLYSCAEKLIQDSNKFDQHDRAYLLTQVCEWGMKAARKLEMGDEEGDLGAKAREHMEGFELAKVSKKLRRHFPMPSHPDWQKDG